MEFEKLTGDERLIAEQVILNFRSLNKACDDTMEAATPEEWATRTLPAPRVRVAFAAIEASDRFGSRWSQWCRRLGILDTENITVIADGAKWIREEQLNHLPAAEGMLDIFHAVEHVAETARSVFGEGTPERLHFYGTVRGVPGNHPTGGHCVPSAWKPEPW